MMSNIFFFLIGCFIGFMVMAILKVGDRDD